MYSRSKLPRPRSIVLYGDFLKYGIKLGNESGNPGQDIGFTLVKNIFWGIEIPLIYFGS